MNGKQLGKFSSAEDDHKLKYVQQSYGVTFLDSPCRLCWHQYLFDLSLNGDINFILVLKI